MSDSHITDDWLEVESAASVMSLDSLPSDDEVQVDDDDHAPILPAKPSPPASAPAKKAPPPAYSPAKEPSLPPPVYPTQSPPLPAESMAIPHPPASDALEPRAPWSFTDPLSEPDIYSATDADYYYKSLCAASISLDATIEKATQLGASRVSTLSFLKSACEDLAKHIGDLKPILAVYAERWQAKGSGMAAGEMPVNASLLEWITTLRTQLHNAQTEMNRIRNPPRHDPRLEAEDSRHLSAKQIPLYLNVALAGCTEALEDTLTTIEEFMPIFKADFDESQTRWMSMPPKETENLNPTPSLKRSRPDFPHPDITRIRRELYSLKDQVRRGHVFLTTIYETIPRPPLPEAPAVLETMDSIIEAISTILTNHASEWIESGYSTSRKIVIPYHEFVALDPDMIHDITGHLQELQDQLEVGEDQLVGQHSPEVVRNHQLVLLTECGQLGEIVSILDLLKSLLLGRDSPTHV
ncbi:hypothetical protein EDB81DRAFT_647028 [Dactylonectria macrodidyma]|uniref:Uncharacterized protein n=1 Tax=Dactylonectria macrodidyma TaxID=307937 RepID=A0A9P9F995_9HYPO|nr:hypothetical protein EDB81DRAFT_647028 [Dactylonectria macrodidyma]